MKRGVTVSLVLGILLAIGCSTTPPESQVSFAPRHPMAGQEVQVIYRPGVHSPLLEADSVEMQAQVYPVASNEVVLKEIAMEKKGRQWVANLMLEEGTGAVLINFAAGEKRDSQNEKGWDLMAYDSTGQPIQGAYSALARTYISKYYLQRTRDLNKAVEYFQQERNLYPENWWAVTASWYARSRKFKDDEMALAKIDAEVDSLVSLYPENKEVLTQAFYYYNRKRSTKKINELVQKIAAVDPKTTLPYSLEWGKIRKLHDVKKQIQEGKALLNKVKVKDFRSSLESWLVNLFLREKDWKNAVAFVEKMEEPDPNLLNQVAWSLAEANAMLLQAEQFAAKSVQLLRERDISQKPAYMPMRVWKSRNKFSLGMSLDTYAVVEKKLGKLEQAERSFAEAYEKTDGHQADITERYIKSLLESQKLDRALEVAQQAVESNEYNDQIVTYFKSAYKEKTGSEAGADSIITAAQQKARSKREKEISGKFITEAQPAPPFTLKNLAGEDVALGSLQGKIVIVDFWATWCGPCKASFPFLEKFWQQHQNDGDVMVLAVNCWEQTKGEERLKAVKKFIKDHGYTFPVLIDTDDKVVTAYKVEGIPTKFFIGPDGKVYFKDVGYPGPTMTDDMNLELKILREKVTVAD